jgi:hypothetical protein
MVKAKKVRKQNDKLDTPKAKIKRMKVQLGKFKKNQKNKIDNKRRKM